ncbi:DEAD/DEAH box helicase [Patescibacteria group bacterium]|nr:DEAD/DEAH box helicase [Patescibacteria group bacterium]
MYKNNRFRQHRNGGRKQGGFRAKTFDPSHIVNNSVEFKQEEYEPKNAFSDFVISDNLKTSIIRRGFTIPTPIQDQAIPEILRNRDVVGIANTGTGKTAAFLIPLINKIILNRREKVLIIAPTRELAVQIEEELSMFTDNLGIRSVICIGGVSIRPQINRLQRNPNFVIGTPGRLLDLSNQRKLNFSQFSSIVLDEVDRMLDMGFIRDIQKIISQLPRRRQSLFFSATVGSSVMNVMKQFTAEPVMISVKFQDLAINVDQEIVKVGGRGKFEVLHKMLDGNEFRKVLVFGRTKRGAEKLTRDLAKIGFLVSAIHGNKSQNQRQRSLDEFRQGRVQILVATDVVARGIDVDNITHVINYELPESYDHYLHRIGRTGRAGKRGKALTFVN